MPFVIWSGRGIRIELDTTYLVDYVYLLREAAGAVRAVHDRHIEGLFPRADWLRWLGEAGFVARVVPFEHSELPSGDYEVFVCTKPAGDQ